ncbi:RE1 [Symbiodinium microadriaticum]|nr:RE1 [Symbiodinium microadriaticum]
MESELEPDYARDGRREGSGSDGPQAEEEAATAERLPRGEMPEAGVHDPVEDRQEEQEAADLLAQAEDLEPEYDFESAEGGVGSPGQEDRLPDMGRATLIDGDRRQGPWVQESRPGDRVLPRGLEGGPSREVGRRSLRQDGAAVNGTAGLGKGSGAPPSFAGWEEAGFTVQASTRLPADIPNWSTQGSRSSEEARMETLEILVQQLLEQNERLKREVRDHSSRLDQWLPKAFSLLRSELLKGLTGLAACDTAATAEYTRTLLAEMELLSVSIPDPTTKRQRKGCKGGSEVVFGVEHSACWVCGGAHQKFECKALLRLGYRIDWNASRCRVYHPKFGELDVDTSTGCPEVDEGVALELIDQYELYVGRQDTVGARLRCIMEDLRDTGNSDLLKVIYSGGAHGDAAFRVYVERLFPEVSKGTLEQCVVSLQDAAEETPTWNRCIRRRCLRSQGVVVHAFCGSARKAFEPVSHLWDLTHLGVDASEDMLNDNTFRFLLQQARDGKIRGVVGGPSDRTFSSARYLGDITGQGPRPIRVPGESIGGYGVQDLSCQEKAQRNVDDVLILRFLLLIALAVDSNRAQGLSDPACIVEHPCPEDDLVPKDNSPEESTLQASLWITPEWKNLEEKFGPFAKGRDEHTSKAKYLVVGVLSVPILAVDGKEVDEPNDADPEPASLEAGGAIEDAEWFGDGGAVEAEANDELSMRKQQRLEQLGMSGIGNGRAEGAIMRVKGKARVILEESESDKSDWPLAAKLAAHELKNVARRRLKIEPQQSLPFNTKVQVISRSWKRETWESRTTAAFVKCPSADMSRGWVVATEDGKLLTTGKLFPSVEQGKVSFSSTGPAVDVDAPEHRITGKRAVRLLQAPLMSEPTHGADKLAKRLFESNLFRPRDLAALAVQVSHLAQDSNRMVKTLETGRDEQFRTCNFLTGAFTYGGMTGLRSNTKDHPWVTRYLTAYMSKYASGLFAGVGLILNVDHALHRDVHNQKGVPNIVLPVVTSGGGLWLQEVEDQECSDCVLNPVSAKVLPNTRQVMGRVCEYRSHKAIKFQPNLWHESVSAHGQQLLLVGYTPRSLHKLSSSDRDMLWQTGFTLLPASKEEFWGYSHAENILTRYHPVPRKHMFVPSDKEWLPLDRSCFGEAAEEDSGEQVCGSVDKLYWNALEALEYQGCELQGYETQLLNSASSVVLRSVSVIDSETPVDQVEPVSTEGFDQRGGEPSDPPPLQTKIIGADQVRREPEKWVPSMTEEYQSLVSRTGAVQELSDSDYKTLLADSTVVLEVIPGKLVYVHKSSGRRKSRIVGCGNYCQGGSSERNELYASGAGAESLRLMIRKCALCPEWTLASVDVRTAFLQAPLLEQQRDGRILSELHIPCEGGVLRLEKMIEDVNLLHIIWFPNEGEDSDTVGGQKAGVVALYVDDILIGAKRSVCEAVIKALQEQWELSSPEWIADTGDQMKFAGYELQKTCEGIRLHQESYTQDLLEQNEEVIAGTERTPAVKMGSFDEVTDDAEKRELTKRSQCLIGQLLWLAGRTRPDLAYGVSMAAQKITSNPREALARAEHLVRYLRGSVSTGLHYKAADGNCGKWDQLRHQQTGSTLDVYTDASFAADEQCRSFGSVHLYWGGALVSWAAARQTLIAAHTAESELYSLSEGHLMGKAFRPTVAALMDVDQKSICCHLYCDNMAAVQLCTLEDLDKEEWALAHLDGVFMPADLGTKPVGEFEEMPGILREDPEFQRVRERFGSPRVPTVARPPGYPGVPNDVVVELERPVYQVGEQARADDASQSSSDESVNSMLLVGSTTSGGARDLQEAESDASVSRSGSGASNPSTASRVAGLSVLMIPRAQGASLSTELVQDTSWELWVVLGLVVAVSMCLGAFGFWLVWKCFASTDNTSSKNPTSVALVSEEVGCDAASTPAGASRQQLHTSSPVVNITVTGSVFEGRAQQPAEGVEVQVMSEPMVQELSTRRTGPQTLGSRGLVSAGTLRRRRESDSNLDTEGPRGLGPGRSPVVQEQHEPRGSVAEPKTLGPKGLGPGGSPVMQEQHEPRGSVAEPKPVGPKGLGPDRLRVTPQRAVQKDGNAELRTLSPEGGIHRMSTGERRVEIDDRVGSTVDLFPGVTSSARKPLDRFRRPWGMKKKEYLSSGSDDLKPFVYLTQYGLCLHSSTTCRPMQSSGFAIQRSLCRVCFESDELPARRGADGADRVVYLTRSGHYVHASDRCECLDANEELLSRKLCQCCRWR